MKRFLTYALSLVMVFSFFFALTVPAFAENSSEETAENEVPEIKFENGQVIYRKYEEEPVKLTINNTSDSDCLAVVYEDYYNIYAADTEAMVVLKFFVGANESATVDAPKGEYGVRIVYGTDYKIKDSINPFYALETGKFSNVEADYIASRKMEYAEGAEVKLDVSLNKAASSTEEIPYTYYISTNHTWEKEYANYAQGGKDPWEDWWDWFIYSYFDWENDDAPAVGVDANGSAEPF